MLFQAILSPSLGATLAISGPAVPASCATIHALVVWPAAEPTAVDPLRGATGLDADGLFESEQRAYRLYMDGVGALADDDPETAIAKWQEAVAVLPDAPPYARSRGALALRMVVAYDERFHRDGSLDDLRIQRTLLQAYLRRLPEMFPHDEDARAQRQAHVRVRIDEIDADLARFEVEHGTTEEQLDKGLRGEYAGVIDRQWSPDPTDMGWHPRPDDPRLSGEQGSDHEIAPEEVERPPTQASRPKGTGLIVAGSITTAVGLAALGAAFGGMAMASGASEFDPDQDPMDRRAQIARGNQGNLLAVAGLAAGGSLVAGGVAMLAIGLRKRKRSASAIAWTPDFGAVVGASVRGRF